jgi:hypothetical protein
MTLEQLVPSLSLCQQLQAAGFPQDTAMVWVNAPQGWINGGGCGVDKDGMVYQIPFTPTDGYAHEVAVSNVTSSLQKTLCAAPTAGELMEWIVVKYPSCALEVLWSDDEWEIDLANDLPRICQGLNGKESLVAALTALVLEVAE